jgi:hypothetical protein
MPEDRINPQPQKDENPDMNNDNENMNNERFESDTQRIVRRHLENENDVITDEDIASVRIGMIPPEFDAATEARFEDEELEEAEDEVLGTTEEEGTDKNLDDEQITPWDTVDPTK